LLNNRDFLFFRQVTNLHIEHETIELRFGQWIRAFHLDRVLRREHMKRPRQIVADALHRNATFLHRFEQRCLRLRRRTIDLVSKHDVGEDWTRDKLHCAPSGRAIFFDDLGAGDVGRHQVGSELNAFEREVEDVGDRAYEQSLRETGHPGDD